MFGHPGGQAALAVTPAQVAQEVTAVGRDLYDRHTTSRDVFILASALAQGDSGGALVNTTGSVIGVAFAIAPDTPGTSYALSTSELQAVLPTRSAARRSRPVTASLAANGLAPQAPVPSQGSARSGPGGGLSPR